MGMRVVLINSSCDSLVRRRRLPGISLIKHTLLPVFVAELLIYYPAVFYAYRADPLNKNAPMKQVSTLTMYPIRDRQSPFLLAHCLADQSILPVAGSDRSWTFSVQFHQSWPGLGSICVGHQREVHPSLGRILYLGSELQTDGTLSRRAGLHLPPLGVLYRATTDQVRRPLTLTKARFQSSSFRWKPLCSLGLTVIVTFFVIWAPVLRHDPLAVLKRLFPFERGLYEVITLVARVRST